MIRDGDIIKCKKDYMSMDMFIKNIRYKVIRISEQGNVICVEHSSDGSWYFNLKDIYQIDYVWNYFWKPGEREERIRQVAKKILDDRI